MKMEPRLGKENRSDTLPQTPGCSQNWAHLCFCEIRVAIVHRQIVFRVCANCCGSNKRYINISPIYMYWRRAERQVAHFTFWLPVRHEWSKIGPPLDIMDAIDSARDDNRDICLHRLNPRTSSRELSSLHVPCQSASSISKLMVHFLVCGKTNVTDKQVNQADPFCEISWVTEREREEDLICSTKKSPLFN